MVMHNNAPTITAGAEISTNLSSGLDPKCENIRRNVEMSSNPKSHNTMICFVFIQSYLLYGFLNHWQNPIDYLLDSSFTFFIFFHRLNNRRTPFIVQPDE